MIDHIGFPVADFARSKAFYETALKPLGYGLVMQVTKAETGGAYEGAGFGDKKPYFWIGSGLPLTGKLEIKEDHTVSKQVILMEVKDGKWVRKAIAE